MRQKQQGSVQVIIIGVLLVAIIGLLGVLFWQNIVTKKPADTKLSGANTTSDVRTTASPTPSVDPVSNAKAGIARAMSTDNFSGLGDYMAPSITIALSNSDAPTGPTSGNKVAGELSQYYADYATNNKQPRITTWTSANFEDTDNALLKKQAASNTFFDFKGSYVSIGKGTSTDAFVAFRLNDQGKATYVYYGMIYGY